MIDRVNFGQLPKQIALRGAELRRGDADLLGVGALASRIRQDVVERRIRDARLALQRRREISDDFSRQPFLVLERDQAGVPSGCDAVGIRRERARRHRHDAAVTHGDRLREMMALKPQAPRAGLRRRAEYRDREALRGTLAGAVALRCQHILQRHHVLRLGDAGGRPHLREQVPCGGLLRCRHLLQPQARLDVTADAEIVPFAPFRPVPSERGGLALVRLKRRNELSRCGQEIG